MASTGQTLAALKGWLGWTVCALLVACDPVPNKPTLVHNFAASPVLSSQTETLTAGELQRVEGANSASLYVLGPSDVISIYVYHHPDLDVPAPGSSGNSLGAMISSDGTVGLPLVGIVHLGGQTLAQAQRTLTQDYMSFVNDANVSVQLVTAQSLRYYLLGSFTDPGIKYPGHPLRLLEALALGGSVDLANADLYQAYIAQGDVKLPIDLHALLLNGDLTQNISLMPGDAIVIPTSQSENAYLFGAVSKPGAVQFTSGSLSLPQALASAGMDLTSYTDARLARVHVIRSNGRSAQFIVVDARMIINGRAAPFPLEPGDIVFVPPTGVATWNQVLAQLIPSMQAVSDALNPFVSLRYLQRH
jgi:polysaccharide export outer membrane protein